MLVEQLHEEGSKLAEAWNFGPDDSDNKSVQWIIEYLCNMNSKGSWRLDKQPQPHEANILKLDSTKAKIVLGWKPKWDLAISLDKTIEWNNAFEKGEKMDDVTLKQIHTYENTV